MGILDSFPTGNFLADIIRNMPNVPSKWTAAYFDKIIQRGNKRIDVLSDKIDSVTKGRVMPDIEQVMIGSGKHFRLSILFLDICGFSSRPNWTDAEQKTVMVIMNLFMAEMLNVVRDFGGTYEKNTGDGFMAYFGENAVSDLEKVRPAVEAAVVMHFINDHVLTPWFQRANIEPVRFRVGIDLGPVTVARVGIRGQENSMVAIGTSANIACKLMKNIPNGGICIGGSVYNNLPTNWQKACRLSDQPTGFYYTATQLPYHAWELNHRLSNPS